MNTFALLGCERSGPNWVAFGFWGLRTRQKLPQTGHLLGCCALIYGLYVYIEELMFVSVLMLSVVYVHVACLCLDMVLLLLILICSHPVFWKEKSDDVWCMYQILIFIIAIN